MRFAIWGIVAILLLPFAITDIVIGAATGRGAFDQHVITLPDDARAEVRKL